ncbi:MAG: head-tail adaptor protein [Rubellimicrobium sp.]|nr:head-tail adaptor protein [Rubellimicrobium sp.]
MRAPNLTRKLMLEAPERVADGAGGFAPGWVALGVVWAEVKPGAGRDFAGLSAALSATAYRITLRAAPVGSPARPAPDQRFREGARLFRIRAVTERDPGGRYLTCLTEEEVAR